MHSVPRLEQGCQIMIPTDLTTEEVAAGRWQRRTACTINVLRADQLEVAEGRRVTGKLYSDNIQTLVGKANGIGSNNCRKTWTENDVLGCHNANSFLSRLSTGPIFKT
jgi:hypothetical protein